MFPVTLITGFLGSGKTTLLNSLISRYPQTRFAIIENEAGETNIDQDLIYRPEGNIFQLSNGCLCCTLNGDLAQTLADLLARASDFDHLLIETTGIALPDAVAAVFVSEPEVQAHFRLDGTICLVDALYGPELWAERETLRRQVSFADYILLNKVDEVEEEARIQAFEALLRQANPFAPIERCEKADFKGNLLDLQTLSPQKLEAKLGQAKKVSSCGHQHAPGESCSHHSHRHAPDADIQVLNLHFDRPFDALKLRHWLKVLLLLQGQAIYRIKALVEVLHQEQKVYVQSVQKSSVWQLGAAWPAEQARQSHWVFIGVGLRADILERSLKQCLVD